MRATAWILALASACTAVVVLDAFILHLLPLGFEAWLVFGSLLLVGGIALGIASLVCWSVLFLRSRPAPVSAAPAVIAGISIAVILAAIASIGV